ncbi:hypothetical protein DVH24_040808 [Malus domestica]|uniref:Uncharacterized protein n=1 Tax=Malus domestica TaxID=3750 RepID=A0A498IDM7_MALDO|nr:hypothetical protein DVH24_040808 [Malus domestica]
MSWATVTPLLSLPPPKLHPSSSILSPSSSTSSIPSVRVLTTRSIHFSSTSPFLSLRKQQICRAAGEYKFPDPIPEFADSVSFCVILLVSFPKRFDFLFDLSIFRVQETEKLRTHLLNKLSKKETYEDSVEEIVGICTEIFSTFLHTEYGGPGTLLVVPFIDMADTLNERGLPGGPQAARAAIKWAQNHVDKDWNEWTGGDEN